MEKYLCPSCVYYYLINIVNIKIPYPKLHSALTILLNIMSFYSAKNNGNRVTVDETRTISLFTLNADI